MFKKIKNKSLIFEINDWIDNYCVYPTTIDKVELQQFLRRVRSQLINHEQEQTNAELEPTEADFKEQVQNEVKKVIAKNAKNKS